MESVAAAYSGSSPRIDDTEGQACDGGGGGRLEWVCNVGVGVKRRPKFLFREEACGGDDPACCFETAVLTNAHRHTGPSSTSSRVDGIFFCLNLVVSPLLAGFF